MELSANQIEAENLININASSKHQFENYFQLESYAIGFIDKPSSQLADNSTNASKDTNGLVSEILGYPLDIFIAGILLVFAIIGEHEFGPNVLRLLRMKLVDLLCNLVLFIFTRNCENSSLITVIVSRSPIQHMVNEHLNLYFQQHLWPSVYTWLNITMKRLSNRGIIGMVLPFCSLLPLVWMYLSYNDCQKPLGWFQTETFSYFGFCRKVSVLKSKKDLFSTLHLWQLVWFLW